MNNDNIQNSLEQDARRIEERIPENMSIEDIRKTAVRLDSFMNDRDLTNAEVGRKLDVGPSAVSTFRRFKFRGNAKKMTNKVINYINSVTRKDRRSDGRPGHIDTTVAQKIAALITNTESFSDEEGKIGLIVGDGGHGKSHCMRIYAQANQNTIYVELDDVMTTRAIFAEIAAAIGVDAGGTAESISRRLIENLQNRQTIVMLDEASGLTVSKLNRLRQIIVVKSRCPLILAGNHGLLDTVMQPTSGRGHESLDQFTSRLTQILNLDTLASSSDKDGGGIYTLEDIRKLYEYGGVRLTDGAAESLRKICRTPRSGRLRTCRQLVTAMRTSPKVKNSKQITAANILGAIEELNLPVRVWLPLMTERPESDQQGKTTAAAG